MMTMMRVVVGSPRGKMGEARTWITMMMVMSQVLMWMRIRMF